MSRCRRRTSSGRSTVVPARAADAVVVERIQFEGYGPGGAAVLVEALTDNRNRTSAEVRHAFTRHGGSLGEPGSVAWMFETHGVVVVDGEKYSEDDLIGAIDAGASDVVEEDGKLRVSCRTDRPDRRQGGDRGRRYRDRISRPGG